jgi:protein TonB
VTRRVLMLAAAAAVHAVAVAAMIVASQWHVDKLEPPDALAARGGSFWIDDDGERADVPPRLGAPAARSLTELDRPRGRRSAATRAPIGAAEMAGERRFGGTGDPTLGVTSGVLGGALGGGVRADAPPPPHGRARDPRPLGRYDRFRVPYTRAAVEHGVSGRIAVRLRIDADGRVASASLQTGLGHGLDEKALALARRFRFRPALDARGEPISVEIPWTSHVAPP